MPTAISTTSAEGALARARRASDFRTIIASLMRAIPPVPQRIARRPLSTMFLRFAKYLAVVILLANIKSLPFGWHIRIFLPVFQKRLEYLALRTRLAITFSSKADTIRHVSNWAENQCPVGQSPFEFKIVWKSFSTLDEGDFYMHLSNSSYAKVLDAPRFVFAIKGFISFGRCGGWIAVGSTHFHFIREIPMLSWYEIRTSIAAWDHKWMYVISRFVSRTPSGKKKSLKPANSTGVNTPAVNAAPHIVVSHPPGTDGANTPAANGDGSATNPDQVAALITARVGDDLEDGTTLHCVAVSRICFKHGRITVPPPIVLACEGFSRRSPSGAAYTPSYAPPHMKHVLALRAPTHGGSPKAFVKFQSGGWRDVPEGERWWEDALGGEIETQRIENLRILDSLSLGMEGARQC